MVRFLNWWGWLGSNQRPTGYEPAALTTELHPRSKYYNIVWPRLVGYTGK